MKQERRDGAQEDMLASCPLPLRWLTIWSAGSRCWGSTDLCYRPSTRDEKGQTLSTCSFLASGKFSSWGFIFSALSGLCIFGLQCMVTFCGEERWALGVTSPGSPCLQLRIGGEAMGSGEISQSSLWAGARGRWSWMIRSRSEEAFFIRLLKDN